EGCAVATSDKGAERPGGSVPPGLTLRATWRGRGETIHRLAWSPDGSLLACPCDDGTTVLWDRQTGQQRRTLGPAPACVFCVAWSPDGGHLATGSRFVRLWDVAAGRPLLVLKDHEGLVYALAWSPDGQTLASAGGDGTIRFWDASRWAPRLTWRGE